MHAVKLGMDRGTMAATVPALLNDRALEPHYSMQVE